MAHIDLLRYIVFHSWNKLLVARWWRVNGRKWRQSPHKDTYTYKYVYVFIEFTDVEVHATAC